MRRPRGPGGRFLTAEEVAQLEKTGEIPTDPNSTPATKQENSTASGQKRKAGPIDNETPIKKNKIETDEDEVDEDEDGEEDLG